jgi:hypothetical protein
MLTGSCHCGACRWTYQGDPGAATACNCTVCRRYGVLWIYGWVGEEIEVTGPVQAYVRADGGRLDFNFCPTCGCIVQWRDRKPSTDGRVRTAVNLRLADDPEAVMQLPIAHFEGLVSFDDLPRDGRTVRDLWF